ncbi:hypothetical protein CR513_49848, partial [Mucuna pruriens]
MTWIYLLDEVFHTFQVFHQMIQTQYSAKICILRFDSGGKYVNQQFCKCHKEFVTLRLCCILCPHLWYYPSYKCSHHEFLGVLCLFTYIRTNEQNLILVLSVYFFFWILKGYRCYDPTTQHTYVTMDVTFLEFGTFYSPKSSNSSLGRYKKIVEPPTLKFLPTIHLLRISPRHNWGKPLKRYSPGVENHRSRYLIANYVSIGTLSEPLKKFTDVVPTNIRVVLEDPKAMNEKMEALNKDVAY